MASRALVYLLLVAAIATVNSNSEGDALNAWKIVLVDPNNVLQSWDPTLVNPCTWFHVTCNLNNSVTRVDLGNASLSGPLVPQLGNLTNLQYFEVYANNISGTIPKEISYLTSLISLDLYQNKLSGPIPTSFGYLKSLQYMRLSSNQLSGAIPPTIGNLTSLIILDLSQNQLYGSIPMEISHLTSLISLDLYQNNLSGSIPTNFGYLMSLQYMRLNSNNITGMIPTEIINLIRGGKLEIMDVSNNALTGSVHSTNSTGFAVTQIIQDPRA